MDHIKRIQLMLCKIGIKFNGLISKRSNYLDNLSIEHK
ncbi:hypothetical protein C3B55_00173 [Candidatus Pseudomonas adelgestsugas]|uniref:Uncharacterized protein n=1 Tax=Candidatus Pseudomonas adelgestsugas TaxID=1302376 RepID=A0ABX5R855_9PSED|nr:hypothetical protein C3B55_00173 [Candidatus Pseudomonas adelgestsugas]